MKRLLLFIILCISTTAFAQTNNLEEVVYLKNGSIIRGVIIEQIPNESLKIQTRDGNVFVYTFDEIIKITKEAPISPQYNNAHQPSANTSITKYKSGGIAFVALGGVFFATGLPLMVQGIRFGLYGRFIPGIMFTATSIPLFAVGGTKLSKYGDMKNQNSMIDAIYISPSVQTFESPASSPIGSYSNFALGGTISITLGN